MTQVFKSFAELSALVGKRPVPVENNKAKESKPVLQKRGKGKQKTERVHRERSKEKLKHVPKLKDFGIEEILFERPKLIEMGFDNKAIDYFIQINLSEEPLQAWYDKKELVDSCKAGDYDEAIYRLVKTLELVQKHNSLSHKRLARLIKLWNTLDRVVKLAASCVTERRIMGSPKKIARQLTAIQAKALKVTQDSDITDYNTSLFINQQDVITDIANLVEYVKTCDYSVSFEEPEDISVRLAERGGKKMSKIPCLLPEVDDQLIHIIPQNIIVQFDAFWHEQDGHTVLPLDGLGYGFLNTTCMLLNNKKLSITEELAENLLQKVNKENKVDMMILGGKILDTESRDWVGFWVMPKHMAEALINKGYVPTDICFPKRS